MQKIATLPIFCSEIGKLARRLSTLKLFLKHRHLLVEKQRKKIMVKTAISLLLFM